MNRTLTAMVLSFEVFAKSTMAAGTPSPVSSAAPATTGTAAKAPANPDKKAAAPAASVTPSTPETPFDAASRKYQAGQQVEALTELQRLAEQGDARAQYLVALDLIEGKYIPRNLPQGFAWLVLACEDKQFGDFIAPKARDARSVIEPQLSGADLIHADTLVAAYRQRHGAKP